MNPASIAAIVRQVLEQQLAAERKDPVEAPINFRDSLADSLVLRLADEGIPVCAMARVLKRPSDELWQILREARDRGDIAVLPAADWPVGSRREERQPTTPPCNLRDAARFELPLMGAFRLTRKEAIFVAVLLANRSVLRPTMHALVSPGAEPKVIDVFACKARKKLTAQGIEIATRWGTGYALAPEAAEAILTRLRAYNEACGVEDAASGPLEGAAA